MEGVMICAVAIAWMMIAACVCLYHIGKTEAEIEQIEREAMIVKDIDPMDPNALGMIEAMTRLMEMRLEADRR